MRGIKNMKRFLICLFSFLFIGCSIAGGAVLLSNSSYSDNTGGGESSPDENDVEKNAPTNSDLWTDGHYADSFAGGDGSEDNPYLISTPEQLARLAYLVNSSLNNFEISYYKQTANLDMSMYWWDAIGKKANCFFYGCYDGNNCTITGLFTEEGENYQGLFGYILINNSDEQYIKNINLNNSEINGGEYVGGIVGYIHQENSTNSYDINISNCSVSADVYGFKYIGGIVGGISYNKDMTFGGSIIVSNCSSKGEIISASRGYNAGGIIGYVDTHYLSITQSYNLARIDGGSGIVSYADVISGGQISYCYNVGDILGIRRLGGIVGSYSTSNIAPRITCCFNLGNIEGNTIIGGIAGEINGDVVVKDCYNRGNVEGSGDRIGGICGYATWDTYITNCYNTGIITGSSNYGAIVGYLIGYAYNCFSAGSSLEICGDFVNNRVACVYIDENYQNCKNLEWFTTSSNWYFSYRWDFNNTWSINENINDGLPYLDAIVDIMVVSITYHPNGASGDGVVDNKTGSESYIIRNNMFTRVGYNFNGWNTEPDGNGISYAVGSNYSGLENLDLYAQWTRIIYTISYNKNASSATGTMANTTKYYGTNVTLRNNAFSRTGYTFAGWATSANGAVVYQNGATYTANASATLFAKWNAAVYKITLNKNGGSGGTSIVHVKYETGWYSNSGATSAISSVTIPSRSGYTFNGYYTATSGGTRIIDSAGKIVGSKTFTTSNCTIYAQWIARNPAYYDEEGGYWYVENGYMPQSKVTGSLKTTLNSQWGSLSNGSTYYMGAISSLASKIYNGNEYCKYNNEFYLVEPIRWRLTSSSSQKTGYGTTTDTLAVMAEIVYVGRYSTSEINAGSGYQTISVNNYMMKNQIDNTYLVSWTQSMPTFGTTSINGAVQNVTSRMFVSSVEEITSVAGSGKIKFSDLVKDYLKSTGNGMLYYTRDLGTNYNNIICLNENGDRTQRKPNLTANRLGVQFTIKVTEYACV